MKSRVVSCNLWGWLVCGCVITQNLSFFWSCFVVLEFSGLSCIFEILHCRAILTCVGYGRSLWVRGGLLVVGMWKIVTFGTN